MEEVEEHRAARASIREQGDVSDTPVDGNQEVCVVDVTLPESRLVELLDKLRASVVEDMEEHAAAAAEGQNTNVDGRSG